MSIDGVIGPEYCESMRYSVCRSDCCSESNLLEVLSRGKGCVLVLHESVSDKEALRGVQPWYGVGVMLLKEVRQSFYIGSRACVKSLEQGECVGHKWKWMGVAPWLSILTWMKWSGRSMWVCWINDLSC